MIIVTCSKCGKQLHISNDYLGHEGICKNCGNRVLVTIKQTTNRKQNPIGFRCNSKLAISLAVVVGILVISAVFIWTFHKAVKETTEARQPPVVQSSDVPLWDSEQEQTTKTKFLDEQKRREILESARELTEKINQEQAEKKRIEDEKEERRKKIEQAAISKIAEEEAKKAAEREEVAIREATKKAAQHAAWAESDKRKAALYEQRLQQQAEEQALRELLELVQQAEIERQQIEAAEHQRELERAAASAPRINIDANVSASARSR